MHQSSLFSILIIETFSNQFSSILKKVEVKFLSLFSLQEIVYNRVEACMLFDDSILQEL